MEFFACLCHTSTTFIDRSLSIQVQPHEAWKKSNSRSIKRLRAKVNDENDSFLLKAAINAASLRFQETNRPEPLFLDQYAGCFAENHCDLDSNHSSLGYSLATKFVDDKLLNTVTQIDGLKQVVLLTDGMDTRPYRLNWPKSTVIYDISPDSIFNTATEKLQGVGAKVPKGSLFRHVSSESTCVQQSLLARGFDGNLPSIWAIQGLPVMNLSKFEEILVVVSSLATNGCFFLGELPGQLVQTEMTGIQRSIVRQWMEKLFMSNGFRVNMISLEDFATSLGRSFGPGNYKDVVFVAEQLRFSDNQMELWRREFKRVEEDADEEGFEEL